MAQKKNKKISNLPKVEKELKDFMADDEGKMTRKDVAKLGVSLAVLGMMMQPESAQSSDPVNVTSHTNTITPGPTANCATHSNITSHSNHANHSSHSTGGWGC